MSEPTTHEEVREATATEYGRYRALGPIDINGARAFNAGDAVPIGHVEGAKQGAPDPDDESKVVWTDVPPSVPRDMVEEIRPRPAKSSAAKSEPKG